jgi:hypothetical protein
LAHLSWQAAQLAVDLSVLLFQKNGCLTGA